MIKARILIGTLSVKVNMSGRQVGHGLEYGG